MPAVRQTKVGQPAPNASKQGSTAGNKGKKCWHPLNGPYQILGQEASMLPDQHLPAMCMGASHAPSTSWRMCEVVYNNCLFFTGCYRTLLARDAKQPNHWKEKIDTFWPHVAPTSKYKWLVSVCFDLQFESKKNIVFWKIECGSCCRGEIRFQAQKTRCRAWIMTALRYSVSLAVTAQFCNILQSDRFGDRFPNTSNLLPLQIKQMYVSNGHRMRLWC